MPRPRSRPRASVSARRRPAKPSQSASTSAASMTASNSPVSYSRPSGVRYGIAPGAIRFRRRNSVASIPVSRAASSISRSSR